MIDLLKHICTLREMELYDFCCDRLGVDGDGDYVYKEGTVPILLVAHLDTVHRKQVSVPLHDPEYNILWSPVGIGGDDRCGVAMILQMATEYDIGVLFTTKEETGCIGAKAAARELDLKDDYNFIVELDRRGDNDAVFYSCDNKEFHEYILGHGFTKAIGSLSDISTLAPKWDLAAVNFSCGYFNEHSTQEFIDFSAMEDIYLKVACIIEDYTEFGINIRYDFQKVTYNYYKNDNYFKNRHYDKDLKRWVLNSTKKDGKDPEFSRPVYPCTDCELEYISYAQECCFCKRLQAYYDDWGIVTKSDDEDDNTDEVADSKNDEVTKIDEVIEDVKEIVVI